MRKLMFPAAAAAALAFVTIDPAKADAQVIVGGYPSYYGSSSGYSTYGYRGGIGNGGLLQLGLNFALGGGGYGGGYSPGYYGGYSSGYRGYSYPSYNRGYNYPSYNRGYSNYGYGNRGYSQRGGYGGRGGRGGHR